MKKYNTERFSTRKPHIKSTFRDLTTFSKKSPTLTPSIDHSIPILGKPENYFSHKSDELTTKKLAQFLLQLKNRFPLIDNKTIKKTIYSAIILSQIIQPNTSLAKTPENTNISNLKNPRPISDSQFIPKEFPGQNQTINHNIEQNYDQPTIRINTPPSGVNWIMPNNILNSENPDYTIDFEDYGWIQKEQNGYNFNPSFSIGNCYINFGTNQNNGSYKYIIIGVIRDRFGSVVAQIRGESPEINENNYSNYNIGFSTDNFSTNIGRDGSSADRYNFTGKQLAFDQVKQEIEKIIPTLPSTNQNKLSNYFPQYPQQPGLGTNPETPTITANKININNYVDNPNVRTIDNLYVDYGCFVSIKCLNGNKEYTAPIQASSDKPCHIMEIIKKEFTFEPGKILDFEIIIYNDSKKTSEASNNIFHITK